MGGTLLSLVFSKNCDFVLSRRNDIIASVRGVRARIAEGMIRGDGRSAHFVF